MEGIGGCLDRRLMQYRNAARGVGIIQAHV
jgi:hypothetical protein